MAVCSGSDTTNDMNRNNNNNSRGEVSFTKYNNSSGGSRSKNGKVAEGFTPNHQRQNHYHNHHRRHR